MSPLDNDSALQTEELTEIDNDFEDEEEDTEEPVILGFVEKPKNPKNLLRQFFPNKAGGVPAWLDPVNLPGGEVCGFCEEPLQFVLQIYAPLLEKEYAFHRMLYVFMCPSMSCLLQDQHEQWRRNADNPRRSVKVFRCQLPRFNPFYSSEAPAQPLTAGAAMCSWCSTWLGNKTCSSCRAVRYCSAKHQSLHWQSDHKITCRQLANSSGTSAIFNNGTRNPQAKSSSACHSLWPEFEILIPDECFSDSEEANCANALVSVGKETYEGYQSLSQKFKADGDKEYFACFQQRIGKAPAQVLRYCRELTAKPLWPVQSGRPTIADIPNCSYCRGPMCYEFQVMPQLLSFFQVKNDPNSLDWGTIAVYTCLSSCQSSVSYKSEFAWVQLYPTGAPF